MKQQVMLKYIISLLLSFMMFYLSFSQNDSIPKDSITYQYKYGLRVGVDFIKLGRSFIDEDYKGLELNADFRLTKNLYIAADIGNEEKSTITDYLNSTASGSYIKGGIDYNLYKNWLGMDNLIYSGLRVSFGTFKQTLNEYKIYDINNEQWGENTVIEKKEFNGLTAIWAELILGLKVETFDNLFFGLQVQIKRRFTETEPDNFENIYIPGFGRTFDSGAYGIGFGYNISYLIPIYKKKK